MTNMQKIPVWPAFLFFGAVFVAMFYLNYHQSFPEKVTVFHPDTGKMDVLARYLSDTPEHIGFAKKFFEHETYLPHPLWHLLVKGLSELSGLSLSCAAVIVSSVLLLLWSLLLYWTAGTLLKEVLKPLSPLWKQVVLLVTVYIIFVVGPLWLPGYSRYIFLGVGSPNIWHNVTLWTVKPLALLAMIFSVRYLEENRHSYLYPALASTLLSIFAKPSFVIVFLPALLLLGFSKHYFGRRGAVSFFLLLFGFSFLILAYQFFNTFGTGSGISIDLFGVWSVSSQNIPVSIFLALAFPLFLFLAVPAVRKDNFILLSWYQVLIGIALFATLAENGPRYAHGNFGWSYQIAMTMLYVFSIIGFFRVFGSIPAFRRIFLLLLLLCQVGIGQYYLFEVMRGLNPLFINITL